LTKRAQSPSAWSVEAYEVERPLSLLFLILIKSWTTGLCSYYQYRDWCCQSCGMP